MTPHVAAAAARRPRITGLVCAAGQKLSVRIDAATDARARALGWMVTETPRRLSLRGRSYHDPRFDARRQHLQTRKGWQP
jgi:hypothetical protein